MHIIRRSSFEAVPWKNGGGITHEAIRVPARGDEFRFRVSVARIEASGPFSDFAAYNRTMVLLEGSAVELRFSNGTRRVLRAVGDMAQFDGALATQCELKHGPCTDLNLITLKTLGEVEARVERLDGTLSLPVRPGCTTLVFPLDAAAVLVEHEAAMLEPWDLALISGPGRVAARVEPRAPRAAAAVFV
ncbi:MAG TPA: HutD family protein, partial [Steroidobacteraceae bacterium]|nr:HutD family protein [Steroidobacteraceae bacterium]